LRRPSPRLPEDRVSASQFCAAPFDNFIRRRVRQTSPGASPPFFPPSGQRPFFPPTKSPGQLFYGRRLRLESPPWPWASFQKNSSCWTLLRVFFPFVSSAPLPGRWPHRSGSRWLYLRNRYMCAIPPANSPFSPDEQPSISSRKESPCPAI